MQVLPLAGHPWLTAAVVASDFVLLLLVSWLTSKRNDNATFFTANRSSAWYVVAFGMIGTSISGITFISIPGKVNTDAFSYFQVVLGYFAGYLVIIQVLLPLYYRLHLTSIYTYLEDRYGLYSYKTGAFFFLLSRSVGSAVRLLLAVGVFQVFIFQPLHIPFEAALFISIGLIVLYSIRGGVKTIIWTDNLQTLFLIGSLIMTIVFLSGELHLDFMGTVNSIRQDPHSQIFFWNAADNKFFVKQFITGLLVTVSMTGLDQDLMQKNLTCRSLKEAQKNVFTYSLIMIVVNLLFLSLGSMLYAYTSTNHLPLPQASDNLFPSLALQRFPILIAITFLIGLTAATFASTDSAITALTSSICIDFLGFNKRDSTHSVQLRYGVHIGIAAVVALIACVLYWVSSGHSIIDVLLKCAAYTYGPLLGLYAFGLSTRRQVRDTYVPLVCVAAPLLTFFVEQWVNGFFAAHSTGGTPVRIGSEIILINSLLAYLGIWLISRNINKIQKYDLQNS